VTFSATWVV